VRIDYIVTALVMAAFSAPWPHVAVAFGMLWILDKVFGKAKTPAPLSASARVLSKLPVRLKKSEVLLRTLPERMATEITGTDASDKIFQIWHKWAIARTKEAHVEAIKEFALLLEQTNDELSRPGHLTLMNVKDLMALAEKFSNDMSDDVWKRQKAFDEMLETIEKGDK